jgi:hypothetical protein
MALLQLTEVISAKVSFSLRAALSVIVGWSCWGVWGCLVFKEATCFAKRGGKSQLTQNQKSHRKKIEPTQKKKTNRTRKNLKIGLKKR